MPKKKFGKKVLKNRRTDGAYGSE